MRMSLYAAQKMAVFFFFIRAKDHSQRRNDKLTHGWPQHRHHREGAPHCHLVSRLTGRVNLRLSFDGIPCWLCFKREQQDTSQKIPHPFWLGVLCSLCVGWKTGIHSHFWGFTQNRSASRPCGTRGVVAVGCLTKQLGSSPSQPEAPRRPMEPSFFGR